MPRLGSERQGGSGGRVLGGLDGGVGGLVDFFEHGGEERFLKRFQRSKAILRKERLLAGGEKGWFGGLDEKIKRLAELVETLLVLAALFLLMFCLNERFSFQASDPIFRLEEGLTK